MLNNKFLTLTTTQKIYQTCDSIILKNKPINMCLMISTRQGLYDFIGGQSVDGETENETMLREFKKQTGFDISYLADKIEHISDGLYAINLHPRAFDEIVRQMHPSLAFNNMGCPVVIRIDDFSVNNEYDRNSCNGFMENYTKYINNLMRKLSDSMLLADDKPEIFIDCDMVILDFNQAMYNLYVKKTGIIPKLLDENAFRVGVTFDIPIEFIKKHSDTSEFWGNMPMMKYDDCNVMSVINELSKDYKVTVLTNMKSKFQPARLKNLWDLGLNVDNCVSTDGVDKHYFLPNTPYMLVDDLMRNLEYSSDYCEINAPDAYCAKVFLNHNYSDTNKNVFEKKPDFDFDDVQIISTMYDSIMDDTYEITSISQIKKLANRLYGVV